LSDVVCNVGASLEGQLTNLSFNAGGENLHVGKNNASEAYPKGSAIAIKRGKVLKALSHFALDVDLNTGGQDLVKELSSACGGAWFVDARLES